MRLLFSLFLVLFLYSASFYAQDVMYTTSGNKIMGKVVEVNTTDIKYKDAANIDGPNYVISKNDIVVITYANGTSQIINENPPAYNPKKEKEETPSSSAKAPDKKKPLNLYYLNNNLLSINALALANGDVTLMYDRSLADNHLFLSVLGGYNFNARMGALNAYIADSLEDSKKKIDVGLGINFAPRNTKRIQYFVGLLAKYMTFEYPKIVSTSNNQYHYESAQGSQFALMVTNGWLYRVSPNFNFKIFGSVGMPFNSPVIKNYEGAPKVYLGYCFGYRFN